MPRSPTWKAAPVLFPEDCTGRPQKNAGEEEIISRVSIAELDTLRAAIPDQTPWFGETELAGRPRPVLALKHSPSNARLGTSPGGILPPGNSRCSSTLPPDNVTAPSPQRWVSVRTRSSSMCGTSSKNSPSAPAPRPSPWHITTDSGETATTRRHRPMPRGRYRTSPIY